MLVKNTGFFSICGQGELIGPTPPCHGFEEYMQELFLIYGKKHSTSLMLIKIGLHFIRNGNNCYFLQ